jgi:hypothetical protein
MCMQLGLIPIGTSLHEAFQVAEVEVGLGLSIFVSRGTELGHLRSLTRRVGSIWWKGRKGLIQVVFCCQLTFREDSILFIAGLQDSGRLTSLLLEY